MTVNNRALADGQIETKGNSSFPFLQLHSRRPAWERKFVVVLCASRMSVCNETAGAGSSWRARVHVFGSSRLSEFSKLLTPPPPPSSSTNAHCACLSLSKTLPSPQWHPESPIVIPTKHFGHQSHGRGVVTCPLTLDVTFVGPQMGKALCLQPKCVFKTRNAENQ